MDGYIHGFYLMVIVVFEMRKIQTKRRRNRVFTDFSAPPCLAHLLIPLKDLARLLLRMGNPFQNSKIHHNPFSHFLEYTPTDHHSISRILALPQKAIDAFQAFKRRRPIQVAFPGEEAVLTG